MQQMCLQGICLVFIPSHEICVTIMPALGRRFNGEIVFGIKKGQEGAAPKKLVIPLL